MLDTILCILRFDWFTKHVIGPEPGCCRRPVALRRSSRVDYWLIMAAPSPWVWLGSVMRYAQSG